MIIIPTTVNKEIYLSAKVEEAVEEQCSAKIGHQLAVACLSSEKSPGNAQCSPVNTEGKYKVHLPEGFGKLVIRMCFVSVLGFLLQKAESTTSVL